MFDDKEAVWSDGGTTENKNKKATYCQGNEWRTDGDEPNRIATIKSKQFVSRVYVVCTRMETALSP